MKRRSGSFSLILIVGVAIGVVSGFMLPARSTARAGSTTYLFSTDALVQLARSQSPYDLLVPTHLPAGMKLRAVIPTGPPEAPVGIYSVDLFYEDGGGNTLHIWQTNIPDLAALGKDPVGVGETLNLDARAWSSTTQTSGARPLQILSARFPTGLTVSIDSTLGLGELERVASSIH